MNRGIPEKPRALKSSVECDKRRKMLDAHHIAPLTEYARSLVGLSKHETYKNATDFFVPHFDPLDGGTNAKVLFIFEKPGPKTRLSEFISRNNDDKTAENTLNFMQQAGLPREWTCLWNFVPIWNGTRKVTPREIVLGIEHLPNLISLFPNLNSIVFVGGKVKEAVMRGGKSYGMQLFGNGAPHLTTLFFCSHPSPIVYATNRAKWESIPQVWKKAYLHASVNGDIKRYIKLEMADNKLHLEAGTA